MTSQKQIDVRILIPPRAFQFSRFRLVVQSVSGVILNYEPDDHQDISKYGAW